LGTVIKTGPRGKGITGGKRGTVTCGFYRAVPSRRKNDDPAKKNVCRYAHLGGGTVKERRAHEPLFSATGTQGS